jgi:tetratricopeptide (TPR) repeat protein
MRALVLLLILQTAGRAQSAYDLALAALRASEADTALALANQEITSNPLDARFHFIKGSALSRAFAKGQETTESINQQVLANYSKAIELNPQYGAAYASRSGALGSAGRYAEGLQDAETALKYATDPRDRAVAYYGMGFNLGFLGRTREALKAYEMSASADNTYGRAHYGKGKILSALKMWKESLSELDQAAKLNPHMTGVWAYRAATLVNLERDVEAKTSAERALVEHPGDPRSHLARALVHWWAKEFAEALAGADRAIEMEREYSEAYLLRGYSLEALGRTREAVETYIASPDPVIAAAGKKLMLLNGAASSVGPGRYKCSDSSTTLYNIGGGPQLGPSPAEKCAEAVMNDLQNGTYMSSDKLDRLIQVLGPPSLRRAKSRRSPSTEKSRR